jgi:hypothetical protein
MARTKADAARGPSGAVPSAAPVVEAVSTEATTEADETAQAGADTAAREEATTQEGAVTQEDADDETDEEEVYQVEKIIKKRTVWCSEPMPYPSRIPLTQGSQCVCGMHSGEDGYSTSSSGSGTTTRRTTPGSRFPTLATARHG